jgi:hypothetical protein
MIKALLKPSQEKVLLIKFLMNKKNKSYNSFQVKKILIKSQFNKIKIKIYKIKINKEKMLVLLL